MVPVAQAVVLSEWQVIHGLGILYLSVIAGVMNRKVGECTRVPGGPSVSTAGMWQATHWLPALSSLWCVCSSRVAVRGPSDDDGPWQSKHRPPRRYITLWTKSLPCMRFLCAVPSGK